MAVTQRRPTLKTRALAWPRRRPQQRPARLARAITRAAGSAATVIVAALLLVVLLGLLGFAIHVLWWLALAALVIWLLGFFLRVGETIAKPPRRRWYYW
jgi:membrane protein YdbS with pleckstrin-like domain